MTLALRGGRAVSSWVAPSSNQSVIGDERRGANSPAWTHPTLPSRSSPRRAERPAETPDPRPRSGQQRPREVVRVERAQVLELLADADQLDRDPELVGDRERDAALGRAVELGEDDPVTPTASPKSFAWRTPFWPVVASTVISVSCGASGICLVMTRRTLVSSAMRSCWVWRRPGGVDDADVGAALAGAGDGVEGDGAGVGALGALDELDAGALAPSARAAPRPRRGTCRRRR